MPITQQISSLSSLGGIATVGTRNIITTGTVLYVDSNNGSATSAGTTPSAPLNSLANALALCTADRGDRIILMPGHTETIEAALSLSVEGVHIIGLGEGDNVAQFTFATDTAAGFTIDSDNVTIENCIFKNNIDSQVAVITANAAYFLLRNCAFFEGSSKQFLIGLLLNNAAADHCAVESCKFISRTAGAASAIKIGAALDDLHIAGCKIHGDWSDAGIHNPTGNVALNLLIEGNDIQNDQAGDHCIELVSACTGTIRNNTLFADTVTLDPGSCKCYGNREVTAIDSGSYEVPSTGSADDFIGRDNADNNAATTNVAANRDGSILERLEYLQANGTAQTPATFVPGLGYRVTKTEDVNVATGDDLFDVTGKVLVTLMTGEVTNAIGAAVTDYKLRIKTDNIDLCAAGDISTDAIGTLYSLTGDATDTLVTGAEGVKAVDHSDSGLANRVIGLASGSCTIQSNRTAGDAADAIVWTLFYLPLEASAAVAAAA